MFLHPQKSEQKVAVRPTIVDVRLKKNMDHMSFMKSFKNNCLADAKQII